MDYKLDPLFQPALDEQKFPLVFDAAVIKAACEHDILLDDQLSALTDAILSTRRSLQLARHRRLCVEVLAAANRAIQQNRPLELSGQTIATLAATLISLDEPAAHR
jgi:hypothetical protein